jgi:hypothetical protein
MKGNNMAKYRKKPVVIEATQFFKMGDHPSVVNAFKSGHGSIDFEPRPATGQVPTFAVSTLEGRGEVTPGDYIITGVQGEAYPCKPDIFLATYEKV